mmetsp:Transcript_22566/g.50990  ORF Transcript_22566/g.50990 Transcript_22566/m.50990 type:complete len:291 (+) Transcript_22566:79-951(+)
MEEKQDDAPEEGAALFSSVMRVYDALPPSGKPRNDEYTVLAAVVACVVGGEAPRYRVLSLATGTKCVGADLDNSQGHLLCDSHAEVLARRGLTHFLLGCVTRCLRDEAWLQSDDCPLELAALGSRGCSEVGHASASTAPLRLKGGWALHLYISDPPCGDACIYPSALTQGPPSNIACSTVIAAGAVDSGTAGVRVDAGAGAGGARSSTGAKAVPVPTHLTHSPHPAVGSAPSQHGTGETGGAGAAEAGAVEVLGCLRTKSGRSDIRAQSRTTSMSCSDKVCRWAALVLQG